MRFRAIVCPKCGGPLPPRARRAVVVCAFCDASVMVDEEVIYASKYHRALRESDEEVGGGDALRIGDLPYRLLGRIGVGESADVHWAERARRIKERVVIKLYRESEQRPRLDAEAAILRRLQESTAKGASHFRRLVPIPVHHGVATAPSREERLALIYRYRSGFVHSFEEIARAHPDGVDARHAAWMWRRILEVLDWVHRTGVSHGAVAPQHLLVHARDHGVMLLGFADAKPIDRGGDDARADDLRGTVRAIVHVLSGGADSMPSSTPAPLRALLEASLSAAPTTLDAWELRESVGAAAAEAFGPPKYHPFHVPSSRG